MNINIHYCYFVFIFMPSSSRRVVVIGGGLSGLSAARYLLTARPDIQLTVLEALDRVGGRTSTVNINGFSFDEGGAYIGQTQKYVLELAKQSGNQILDQSYQGEKVIQMQHKVFNYQSKFPSNFDFWDRLEMKFFIWKINRLSKRVSTLNPKDCEQGYQWDMISAQTWINQNIRSYKLKALMQLTFKSTIGVQLTEISLLYLLWFVRQNENFDNVETGLQAKKTKLGTQHMSKYLAEVINSKNGKILFNVSVKKIEQKQNICYITDRNNKVYQCDYLIMACSPWQANKINFFPQLSTDRKMVCERGFMGSYIKVILLYKRAYWKEKGLSGEILTDCLDSPLMWSLDETKYKQNGETQPALIVFVAAQAYRDWKSRNQIQQSLVRKFAKIVDEPEMLEPVKVYWKAWDDEPSIGGGPAGHFGPGVLSQVDDLRKPEGAIHWAGTELATVSAGYMDGAIQSGIRAGKEVTERLNGHEEQPITPPAIEKGFWYTKFTRTARKWVEWL